MSDNKQSDVLKGIIHELWALQCYSPESDFQKGYNEGMKKAIRIIQMYQRGNGLFQITNNSKNE